MDRHGLHEATAAAFRLVSATNEFVAAKQPWALAKDPAQEQQLTDVLYDAAEAVRIAAVLLLPVMPASAAEILRRMGDRRPAGEVRLTDADWRPSETKQISNAGAALAPHRRQGSACCERDPSSVERAGAAGAPLPCTPAPAAAPPPAPVAPATPPGDGLIAIDDFMKVELRDGEDPVGRAAAEVEEAAEALGGRRRAAAAHDPRRHRRELRARGNRRPLDRHRRQPQAARDDGHRLERHGPGRQHRQRPGDAGQPGPGAPGTRVGNAVRGAGPGLGPGLGRVRGSDAARVRVCRLCASPGPGPSPGRDR